MGRRFTSMTMDEATAVRTKRGSRSLRCHQCPKWANGYCSIFAKGMVAVHPCCAYGKMLMRTYKMRRRRGKEAE